MNKRKKGDKFEGMFLKTINSGAFHFDKGDAKNEAYLLEIKGTNKKSFRITTELLNKIHNEAFDSNKFPMFGIVIDRDDVRWLLQIKIEKEIK